MIKNNASPTTIHERIALCVQVCGKGKNTLFAGKLGVSEGNIRGYIKNVVPKADMLENIVRTYDISPEWLLTGKGDMMSGRSCETFDNLVKTDPTKGLNYIPPTAPTEEPKAHLTENPQEGIPLIPFSAMAGAMTGELSAMEYECERYVVPAFKGADFLMSVKGNSMTPTYLSGDIVACQRVPMTNIFFQWNKPYVLDTAQGAIIKRIKPGTDTDHIRIISDNTEYDPYELPLSEIHAVALVIGIIRLE